MNHIKFLRAFVFCALLFVVDPSSGWAQNTPPKYPDYPSETPARFKPFTDSFDYMRRDVMIPMRDGVKLHTVILVPKGCQAQHRSC